jgi:putative aminopeptidase FrvX
VAVLDREFAVLNGSVVTGKAFDDRVGVAVMLYALRQLEEVPVTLYARGHRAGGGGPTRCSDSGGED